MSKINGQPDTEFVAIVHDNFLCSVQRLRFNVLPLKRRERQHNFTRLIGIGRYDAKAVLDHRGWRYPPNREQMYVWIH
jgi:hypothetical protein